MTRKIRTRLGRLKLRSQLALLILIFGLLSIFLFRALWGQRWGLWELILDIPGMDFGLNEDFWETLRREALKYDLPASEKDTEAVEKLEPFLQLGDKYTGIYVYGLEDGLYRAGQYPRFMEEDVFRDYYALAYDATTGLVEMRHSLPVEFRNGDYGEVAVTSLHGSLVIFPYYLFCLAFSVAFFLAVILLFVSRKMRHVAVLKQEVLRMSSGDLDHPVPAFGGDEIGTLSRELDGLRLALSATISGEKESRLANQDLITAMSHDLRTPLTILNGYLEILRLNRNPEAQREYLERCVRKTGEIREMTDRMFEYALVYEETEEASLSPLSLELLGQCLRENADYIGLTGFLTELRWPAAGGREILGDATMVKRVFSNLFSNIIKYGEKREPVVITGSLREDRVLITLENAVKQDYALVESSHIGLKSVRKMMELMNGTFTAGTEDCRFLTELSFPLSPTAS